MAATTQEVLARAQPLYLCEHMYSFRSLIKFSGLLLVAVSLGCGKDDTDPPSKVDKNGLTKQITDLVPQTVIDEMKRQGMPIYGGDTPPLLARPSTGGGATGSSAYLIRPFELLSSNVPNDVPGKIFDEYRATFYEQDNENLTLKFNYTNGNEQGTGLGSFVVGAGNKFSVFVEVNATAQGQRVRFIQVISGVLGTNRIEDLHAANFVLDDYGDPMDIFIGIGQGRVFQDKDGVSELQGGSNWYASLPDCPCTYAEVQSMGATTSPAGHWAACGGASTDFHYGATYEARWLPAGTAQAGQQCTYGSDGKLITGGIAAGSPDKRSPGYCGFWSWLADYMNTGNTNGIAAYDAHNKNDIEPWQSNKTTTVACWEYLRDWPANNGRNCSSKVVSGIDHMRDMVGNMSCEEATTLIRRAKESPSPIIDAGLRNHILGASTTLTKAELIVRLQSWKAVNLCGSSTDKLCPVIDKAIANLR